MTVHEDSQFPLILKAPCSEAPLTMSSLEIAELLGSRHDKVKQSIERLANKGVIVQPPMGDEPGFDSMGRPRPTSVYLLDKRSSLIVVAQLSPEFTALVVDRWQELEAALSQPRFAIDPSDPKVMLACFNFLQKQVAEKDAIIAEQGVKVKQLDRLSAADGSMCLRDAAKTLNVRPKDLIAFLSARRWIYKRPGNSSWIAYQDKIQAGLMEHIDHPFFDDQQRERIATRTHVTARGLVKLAELLNQPLH